ncbi:putative ribonuclease H-like domain-containing protein [Tanacetum coccineum]
MRKEEASIPHITLIHKTIIPKTTTRDKLVLPPHSNAKRLFLVKPSHEPDSKPPNLVVLAWGKIETKTTIRVLAFKLKELDKSEEPKALLSVDSMLNWSDHEGEDEEKGAAQVYGMIAGDDDDAAGDASGDVSDAAAEFALMGLTSQVKLEKLNDQVKLEESKARNIHCLLPYKSGRDDTQDSEPTGFAFVFQVSSPQVQDIWEHVASASSSLFKKVSRTDGPLPSKYSPHSIPRQHIFLLVVGYPQHCFFDGVAFPAGSWNNSICFCREESGGSAVKTSQDNPHKNKDLGIVDSGCSRSMTASSDGSTHGIEGWLMWFSKTSNKLATKYGLVNGLPSKLFTNYHNCVACNKGKQHKASYKLNKKVKAIRCDNGTKFKNSKLIELCGSKRIKRDYSNARTLQQNGIAERKNRTLIEAARTMLADSKLPTMFWTEAVSTACYVLNRVLVTKPHNKTPYELVSGKVPNISHLKPFGCLVTILNTSDHLGKFEGKADEGFIVGYAAHSKAYRVYNLSSKKIEETLNLRYLEDKPNVQGLGHEWYFDLDYLTDSLGYTRFKTNQPAGTQDTNIHAGTQDDSDSECDEQVIVVPSFPSNSFSGPKVHDAIEMAESSSDYAEELVRLQKQAYEANATAEKHLSQVDLAASRNRVPAGKIDSAAGVSYGPTETSTPVFKPVHTDATSLPPSHLLGSSAHSTRYPSPSDLANSMSSSSKMEDIHHHPDTSIFSSSSYDDDFGGTVTNLAPSIVVDYVPTKRVKYSSSIHSYNWRSLLLLDKSVAQALNDPAWVEAIQEELQPFINYETLVACSLYQMGKLPLDKYGSEDQIRDAEVYCKELKPVARLKRLGTILSICLIFGNFWLYQMDVKVLSFMGKLKKKFMLLNLRDLKILISLSMFKELLKICMVFISTKDWYARLSTFLLKHNYRRGTIDKTLFIKKNSRDIILVQVYVDDIILGLQTRPGVMILRS